MEIGVVIVEGLLLGFLLLQKHLLLKILLIGKGITNLLLLTHKIVLILVTNVLRTK